MKKLLEKYKLWELIWIPLSLILISGAWLLEYFLTPASARDTVVWQIVYFIATFTGMLCVVLASGKRWFQWIIGLINIAGFVALYWHWQLYGNFGLNLAFYIPASVIGIIFWLKHRDTKATCHVQTLSIKNRIILSVASVVAVAAIAIPLSYFDRSAGELWTIVGFLDSTGTVLGVIGQVLLNLRYAEQWWIWIILDIVMAILNFVIGQYAMAIMYVLWTTNAVIGLIVWVKSSKKDKLNQENNNNEIIEEKNVITHGGDNGEQ